MTCATTRSQHDICYYPLPVNPSRPSDTAPHGQQQDQLGNLDAYNTKMFSPQAKWDPCAQDLLVKDEEDAEDP